MPGDIVKSCLRKDPEQRQPTAGEMRDGLRQGSDDHQAPRERLRDHTAPRARTRATGR
jgi:hypothetical protein